MTGHSLGAAAGDAGNIYSADAGHPVLSRRVSTSKKLDEQAAGLNIVTETTGVN